MEYVYSFVPKRVDVLLDGERLPSLMDTRNARGWGMGWAMGLRYHHSLDETTVSHRFYDAVDHSSRIGPFIMKRGSPQCV